MNILVTGGAGFLGSVLVPELLRAGHTVRVLDRFMFGEGSLDAVAAHEKLSIRRGDIRRLQEIDGLFGEIDTVLHLAAVSDEASCALDVDAATEVNVAASR
ncbi:MAG: NAD(P)-dependent oxidoreductase [Candidatus Hydrogenedentota bacterium]